jgi:hypothetical protein
MNEFVVHRSVTTSLSATWQLEWFVVVEEENWALLLAPKCASAFSGGLFGHDQQITGLSDAC